MVKEREVILRVDNENRTLLSVLGEENKMLLLLDYMLKYFLLENTIRGKYYFISHGNVVKDLCSRMYISKPTYQRYLSKLKNMGVLEEAFKGHYVLNENLIKIECKLN